MNLADDRNGEVSLIALVAWHVRSGQGYTEALTASAEMSRDAVDSANLPVASCACTEHTTCDEAGGAGAWWHYDLGSSTHAHTMY